MGGTTSSYTLSDTPFEGLVEFNVFPGAARQQVTIGLDQAFADATNRYASWKSTGANDGWIDFRS